jgi:hypothetical protein
VREEAIEDLQVARRVALLYGIEQNRAVGEEDVGTTVKNTLDASREPGDERCR